MKKIFSLLLCTFVIFSCSKNMFKKEEKIVASEDFAQGSEDIPLLIGMSKISEDSIGFDTNSGSIMSSSYTTKNDLMKVREFYIKTLPQMGWKIMQNGERRAIFKREKEKLEIEFSKEDGKNIVRFFISSRI